MRMLIVFAAGIALAAGLLGGSFAAFWLLEKGTHVGWAVLGVVAGVAAVWAALWLSRLDDRLKRKAGADWVAHANERFKQLVVLASAHDFELKVKGSSQFWFALVAVAFGSAAFLPGMDWWLRVLAAVTFIPGGILLLLQAIPQLGRPVITLTRSGFRTPTSPEIPWRLVYCVLYSESKLSPRDSEALPYGTLIFDIPTLRQEASRFSLIGRLTHGLIGKQSRITVTLRKTSEPPSAVGRLAEHLWMQSRGRTRDA